MVCSMELITKDCGKRIIFSVKANGANTAKSVDTHDLGFYL